jgi:hypothetical protein
MMPSLPVSMSQPDELWNLTFAKQNAWRDRFAAVPVDALSVGAIGVTDGDLFRVVFGLGQTFGERFIPCLRFDDGELGVAVFENVVGTKRVATPDIAGDAALDTAWGNPVIAPNAAAIHHTPSRRFQRGINVLGSGFGFVHISDL